MLQHYSAGGFWPPWTVKTSFSRKGLLGFSVCPCPVTIRERKQRRHGRCVSDRGFGCFGWFSFLFFKLGSERNLFKSYKIK